jgi:hypothetical protein
VRKLETGGAAAGVARGRRARAAAGKPGHERLEGQRQASRGDVHAGATGPGGGGGRLEGQRQASSPVRAAAGGSRGSTGAGESRPGGGSGEPRAGGGGGQTGGGGDVRAPRATAPLASPGRAAAAALASPGRATAAANQATAAENRAAAACRGAAAALCEASVCALCVCGRGAARVTAVRASTYFRRPLPGPSEIALFPSAGRGAVGNRVISVGWPWAGGNSAISDGTLSTVGNSVGRRKNCVFLSPGHLFRKVGTGQLDPDRETKL